MNWMQQQLLCTLDGPTNKEGAEVDSAPCPFGGHSSGCHHLTTVAEGVSTAELEVSDGETMNYNRVFHKFFTDLDVLKWEREARHFALYLLTCPYRTSEGFFQLPLGHASLEWGFPVDKLESLLFYLQQHQFLLWDDDNSLVLLLNGLKYERPTGPLQEKGAVNKLKELPSDTPLWPAFYQCCAEFSPSLAALLLEEKLLVIPPEVPANGDNPDATGKPFAKGIEGVSKGFPSHTQSLTPTHTQSHNNTMSGKPDRPTRKATLGKDAEEVFRYYCEQMDKTQRYVFKGTKREAKVVARLSEGYTVADLKQAIDGCKTDAFSMGDNDRGTAFNDLELICRDAIHVDRFMEKGRGKSSSPRAGRITAAREWLAKGKHEAGARALVQDEEEWEEVIHGGR